MRKFSGHFVFTNTGPALKRGIVTTDNEGVIVGVEDTGGDLVEKESVEFYNGIIIPGFVNCHCHLELSDLHGIIPSCRGLADFILDIRTLRSQEKSKTVSSATSADEMLQSEGIVLCADICNTDITFGIKKKSRIKYLNLLEAFGIDAEKAEKRISEISEVVKSAKSSGLHFSIVPHSTYSVSLSLFNMLKSITASNKVTSLHFMESLSEIEFLKCNSGPIKDSYERSGLKFTRSEIVSDHADAVLDKITSSGNLILVHNTFVDRNTIRLVNKRDNLYWCLCLGSNLYIENALPPVYLLIEEGCEIVIGTDSLASNKTLSLIEELKLLSSNFETISLEELVRWATYNGAKALCEDDTYGSIAPGKRPGLLLIEDLDLNKIRLTKDSRIKKLI